MSLQPAMRLLALSVTSCCSVQEEAKAEVAALASAARKLELGDGAETHVAEAQRVDDMLALLERPPIKAHLRVLVFREFL